MGTPMKLPSIFMGLSVLISLGVVAWMWIAWPSMDRREFGGWLWLLYSAFIAAWWLALWILSRRSIPAEAAALLGGGRGVHEVARLMGVSPSSVSRWKKSLAQRAPNALATKPGYGPSKHARSEDDSAVLALFAAVVSGWLILGLGPTFLNVTRIEVPAESGSRATTEARPRGVPVARTVHPDGSSTVTYRYSAGLKFFDDMAGAVPGLLLVLPTFISLIIAVGVPLLLLGGLPHGTPDKERARHPRCRPSESTAEPTQQPKGPTE